VHYVFQVEQIVRRMGLHFRIAYAQWCRAPSRPELTVIGANEYYSRHCMSVAWQHQPLHSMLSPNLSARLANNSSADNECDVQTWKPPLSGWSLIKWHGEKETEFATGICSHYSHLFIYLRIQLSKLVAIISAYRTCWLLCRKH